MFTMTRRLTCLLELLLDDLRCLDHVTRKPVDLERCVFLLQLLQVAVVIACCDGRFGRKTTPPGWGAPCHSSGSSGCPVPPAGYHTVCCTVCLSPHKAAARATGRCSITLTSMLVEGSSVDECNNNSGSSSHDSIHHGVRPRPQSTRK